MHKNIKNVRLQVDFIKEGKTYIAYSPALDLSTCGKTIADAKKSFDEAVQLFLDTIIEMGTYKEVLINLGWRMHGRELRPPVVIERKLTSVSMPTFA